MARPIAACLSAWLAVLGLLIVPVWGGGGPENVLLVVNQKSLSSRTIANHYVALRQIPSSNVVYIDWHGSVEYCPVKRFRQQILSPAVQAIRQRKLDMQIDCVTYSTSFPWGVLLKQDFAGQELPQGLRPTASLTGATYLWHMVQSKDPFLFSLKNNYYALPSWFVAQQPDDADAPPSRTFRSRFSWGADGNRVRDRDEGRSYLMSTMLGVTSGRGNSVAEVINYLTRAAAADGLHPHGTVYLMRNADVRSRVRHDLFSRTAAHLGALGVRAEILDGVLPKGRRDVQGLMVGAAEFDLAKAGLRILPGAICEHLTSFGGILKRDHYQTPLSVFLRLGAAGASGTVVEPQARQQKFPLPAIHVHYARGCSLAEAFYQSVVAPLQLLVVGDPICMPWANAPQIVVDPPPEDTPLTGTVRFTPRELPTSGPEVGVFLLYIDGRLVAARQPGDPFLWDTTSVADGYHEVRVVGIRSNSIATQGRVTFAVDVDNHDIDLEFEVRPAGEVSANDVLTLSATASSAEGLVFLQHERELGRVDGSAGQLSITAGQLGRGPVVLQARTRGPRAKRSPPVALQVR